MSEQKNSRLNQLREWYLSDEMKHWRHLIYGYIIGLSMGGIFL